jgi:dipeptidyl aminopeptidase/acylaminoacyl peptidase
LKGARWIACLLVLAGGAHGANAVRWTPPALASDQYESSPTFSPDGREMVFFRGDATFSRYRLFESRCVDGRWSEATAPVFAAPASVDEADPAFSPDGRRLYFVSSRGDPRPRGEADLDIWFVDRDARGHWRKPERMPEPVNSPGSELLPRPQPDGSLVFGSDRAGGLGGSDIYVARPADGGWRIENLGAPVNTAASEYEAELSRDGRLLIVVADRGDRSHFYPYRRESGGWVPQPRIVPRLEVFQVGPLLSPTADRLLFAQADDARSGELFVMDLAPGADRAWPPACGY